MLFALVLQQKQLPSWSEVVFLLSILVAYKASGKPETLLMWPLSYTAQPQFSCSRYILITYDQGTEMDLAPHWSVPLLDLGLNHREK